MTGICFVFMGALLQTALETRVIATCHFHKSFSAKFSIVIAYL